MRKDLFVKILLLVLIVTVLGLIGYIIGMMDLFGKISNEKQIDFVKYDKYIRYRKNCDVINATILSISSFSCDKAGCAPCDNRCRPPKIIDISQYKCFVLSIINQNEMVYTIPVEGCLRNVDTNQIYRYKDPWSSPGFSPGIIFGVIGWAIAFGSIIFVYILSGIRINKKQKNTTERQTLLIDDS